METNNSPGNSDQLNFGVSDVVRQLKKHWWIPVLFLLVLVLLEWYAVYQPYPQFYVGKDKIFVGKAKVLLEEKNLSKIGFDDFWNSWVHDDLFMSEVLSKVPGQPSSSPADLNRILRDSINPNLTYQVGPGHIVVSLQLPAREVPLIRPFLKTFTPALMEKMKLFIEKIPDNPAANYLNEVFSPKLLSDPDSPPVPLTASTDKRRMYAFIPLAVLLMALLSLLVLEYLEKSRSPIGTIPNG